MLNLTRVAPHEWEFVYPAFYDELMDEFNTGCESYEEGNLDQAEKIFRAVLSQMPDHLDTIHHFSYVSISNVSVYIFITEGNKDHNKV